MKKHTLLPALILSILATLFIGLASVWAAEPEEAPARGHASSGIVTGLTGPSAVLTALEPASSRVLKLGDTITAGEGIRTNPGGQVEILWGRRALLTVPEQAQVRIVEPLRGQILVQLSNGTVRAALSYSASHPMDVLTVQTPTTRATIRGGIVEVTAVSTPIETIRVLEGQARIEPLTPGANSRLLQAGQQVRLHGGAADTVSEFNPTEEKERVLSAMDQHRLTPKPVTQQIVGVHIEHALEVERLLQRTTTARSDKELSGPDLKGAIIPTSIIPTSTIISTTSLGVVPAPVATTSATTSAINQSVGPPSPPSLQDIFSGKGKKPLDRFGPR